MRLPPREGERLDRSREIAFSFGGERVRAHPGDTIGSALFADGRRVFSRSFKYHRPRGLMCCTGSCPNCLMEVDGVPDVRVCTAPAREGAVVKAQNVVGSVDRDLLGLMGTVMAPFTPVGFYYRTMIRPRRLWPVYERVIRRVAGLGRVDRRAGRRRRFDTEHRRAEVLVVGGGRAGREAAAAAAERGAHVVLVDEGHDPTLAAAGAEGGYEVIAPARAIGVYEGGLVPVDAGAVMYRFRAGRIVVAAGALEQPLVFPGNDLVGVVLPSAVRRLVRDWSLVPGERAVVITADDTGLAAADDLRAAGVEVARTLDVRTASPRQIVARGRHGHLTGVEIDGESTACDVLVMSGGRQPAYSLLVQSGATVEYDARRGIFTPTALPEGVDAVGAAAGELGPAAVPAVSYAAGATGKCFVCLCEDVTEPDLIRAVGEGFDQVDLAKRYTTVTMGPCQGRLCHLSSVRMYARENNASEASIGATRARPPWGPVPLGLLAGRGHEPTKRTPLHHRHEERRARMMWAGAWRRAHSYGDVAAEVRAVHEAVGLIDVSTLGKLLVTGPDAAAFLERLYPNRFGNLAAGRVRYGVLTTDAGRIFDDGTIARLDEQSFYVTTTSSGAETVIEWFEWWNAVWGMGVEIVDLTGALAAVNVAGPRSRELLGRLTDLDLTNEVFAYLDAKHARVAGVPSLALRIGFVGELGYELHFPAPLGEHVWDTVLARGDDLGVRPFGLEPQRVLRLEKQHILAGQDTDSESDPLAAAMSWIVKFDKDDFVGKWALEHARVRGPREQLVGFRMANGTVPPEGGQVVRDGVSVGRVTSARWSGELGAAIGLAWVRPELAEEDTALTIAVNGGLEPASVRRAPFLDPDGTRMRG